ncbi:MAG: VWA domain-containing protein, partial [Phyllobacteriaceae bacterium]|nr:VWA domain-containing protein [Phyllobacteriaceae bacterium]
MAFRFRSYLSSVNGNTSMIFAVSMMSLVVASGVAIDFGQMVTAKTSANAIADAAALAAVSLSNGTESEMKRIAKDYVDTNTKGLDFKVGGEPSFEYDAKTGEFVVELQGEVSASFLSLAGIANAGVTARSVAVKPDIPPVEMVLALDTTGSMTGSKIMALKAAASKMVKAVLKNKDAKIGIVPFSN